MLPTQVFPIVPENHPHDYRNHAITSETSKDIGDISNVLILRWNTVCNLKSVPAYANLSFDSAVTRIRFGRGRHRQYVRFITKDI